MSRTLAPGALATLVQSAQKAVGPDYVVDQTLRGDRLGLSVAATMEAQGDPLRASDRIGEPNLTPPDGTLGGLPIVRLDATQDGAKPASSTPVPPPDLSTDFRRVRVLGEGGMGQVILAHQQTLDREVAIKRTKAEVADASAAASLLIEARIMGALEHPNIVPVHLLARDGNGNPVLVMKRIEGVSWRDLLLQPDHPVWDRLQLQSRERLVNNLEILMQVCSAVHFAHSRGVIHRDIKPENVMLGGFGEVYLVDWGIATGKKAHRPSASVVGTPSFMAPEMLHQPDAVTTAVDVYLLGSTLHYLVTGRYRHEGTTIDQVLRSVSSHDEPTYDADVPDELAQICRRAMAMEPSERWETADALREALRDFLRHRASIAICDDGKRRLGELRLLQKQLGGKSAGAKDSRRIHQLLTQARFAFDQALREWPENPLATEQRQLAIGMELDHELASANLESSQRLLAELALPTEAQREAVRRLREKKRQLDADQVAFAALRHDNDPRVGLRSRTAYIVGVIIIVLSFSLAMSFVDGGHIRPTYPAMFVLSGLLVVLGVGGFYRMSRTELFTTFNRRALTTIIVALTGGFLIRFVSWRLALPPMNAFVFEQLLYAVILVLNAVTLHSTMGWGALPQIAGVIVSLTWPDLALYSFIASGVGSFAVLGLVWHSQLEKEGEP